MVIRRHLPTDRAKSADRNTLDLHTTPDESSESQAGSPEGMSKVSGVMMNPSTFYLSFYKPSMRHLSKRNQKFSVTCFSTFRRTVAAMCLSLIWRRPATWKFRTGGHHPRSVTQPDAYTCFDTPLVAIRLQPQCTTLIPSCCFLQCQPFDLACNANQ